MKNLRTISNDQWGHSVGVSHFVFVGLVWLNVLRQRTSRFQLGDTARFLPRTLRAWNHAFLVCVLLFAGTLSQVHDCLASQAELNIDSSTASFRHSDHLSINFCLIEYESEESEKTEAERESEREALEVIEAKLLAIQAQAYEAKLKACSKSFLDSVADGDLSRKRCAGYRSICSSRDEDH